MNTKHAEVRAQQRGIPPMVNQLLDLYGQQEHDGRGAVVVYLSKLSIRNMARDLGRRPVSRLAEWFATYKVISTDGQTHYGRPPYSTSLEEIVQMQPTLNAQPQFQLQELEQIESAMQASLRWLETLDGRRAALTAELERFTRPQDAPSKSPTTMIGPGLEYRGEMSVHWNFIDIHIALLRRLWNDFGDQREAMARAIRSCGITRVYVAKSPADLFPNQSTIWVQRHSRPLAHGWYVDTNLSRERMSRILPAAVDAAGLKWGNDVKVYWQQTQIPA